MAAKDRPQTIRAAQLVDKMMVDRESTYEKRLLAGLCPTCGNPAKIEDLKDEPSKREYRMTGICQPCQDKIFKD